MIVEIEAVVVESEYLIQHGVWMVQFVVGD
jgi:hypothetical protein